MAAPAPAQATKMSKPKKTVQASGRGGSGNYRKVKEKSYTTEVSKISASTAKKIIEVEIPRYKASYTGRGGQGNVSNHVLEDGVFQRVMTYELGKVQAYRDERDAKRRSTARARAYSQSKPSLGSDDSSSAGSMLRRSWASKSTVELTPQTPVSRDARKTLRETLLAPLRTTFTRNSRLPNPKSVRSDSSSFFAGSSSELGLGGYPTSPLMSPISAGSGFDEDLEAAAISPASDGASSAALITPSNAEMFGELAGNPVPRRTSTGTHRSSAGGPPPMPSPTTPLPPLPSISINGGRSSLPVPLPPVQDTSPPPMPPVVHQHRTRVAFMPMKSLRAIPAPVVSPVQLPTVTTPSPSTSRAGVATSSASFSHDRLAIPDGVEHVGNMYLRAPNRRLYNASIAARSLGHLPMSMAMDPREASFYDDTDVDRVDPFLAHLGGHEGDKSFASLMPWINNAPGSALSSTSSISIPSFNDSQPDLVTA